MWSSSDPAQQQQQQQGSNVPHELDTWDWVSTLPAWAGRPASDELEARPPDFFGGLGYAALVPVPLAPAAQEGGKRRVVRHRRFERMRKRGRQR